jgi:hypothetical protein
LIFCNQSITTFVPPKHSGLNILEMFRTARTGQPGRQLFQNRILICMGPR